MKNDGIESITFSAPGHAPVKLTAKQWDRLTKAIAKGDFKMPVSKKAAKEHEEKQEPLFGPVDEVVNALELARADIMLDIDSCINTITKKKSELESLTKRREQLESALKTAKGIAEEANAEGKSK